MTSPVPLVTWAPLVTGISQCVLDALALTTGGTPSRACVITPQGVPMPWDNCECGQFTATVVSVWGSDRFPSPVSVNWKNCNPPWLVATVTMQVVRCVPAAVMTGTGVILPTCAAMMASAIVQDQDRAAMIAATACCLQTLATPQSGQPPRIGAYLLSPAVTLPEQGGCGGIEMSYQIAVSSCLCGN